jgi:hypothetical protein
MSLNPQDSVILGVVQAFVLDTPGFFVISLPKLLAFSLVAGSWIFYLR